VRVDEIARPAAREEIRASKAVLEDALGHALRSFAYPHGAYDAAVRRLVVDAGFESAAAVKDALCHEADDPFAIARWTVRREASASDLVAVASGAAPLAWGHERRRTLAYRHLRRARRLIGARL